MPTFTEKQFKTILNKKKFIDSWFWDRYSINPYNGCLFGCIYCDARSSHYHMPEDFENQIVIKKDVGQMLDQRLRRARTLLPDVVGLGGVTDSYQPAERKYGNTRACLEVLARHGYPVHLATKSALVLRDSDLLERIGSESWATVSFTVTTLDPEMAAFLDGRAPTPQQRLATVTELKARAPHVKVGVLLIPLVPFLADDDAGLAALVAASKQAGADYLLFGGGMTLRDMQASFFLGKLQARFPDLYPAYQRLYRFTTADPYDGQYGPVQAYLRPKHRLLRDLCRQHALPYRIPRYLPADYRRLNYQIAEQLLNQAYERQLMGQAWSELQWAGQNIQNLAESIADVAMRDELGRIGNVRGAIQQDVVALLAKFG